MLVEMPHCINETCPLKERCWRFKAPIKEGDIIVDFYNTNKEKATCFYPFE